MKRAHWRLAALAFLAVSGARAEDGAPSPAMSGYGTLAYTMADSGEAGFGRASQLHGAGRTPVNWVDSNVGIQGTVTANDWLSFTAQGLARKLASDDWGAELYWAYAKARLAPGWSLYAGRVAAPVFLISDYRNVGYANTMMRPPQELYAQVPFDTADGATVGWQDTVGDVNLTAQLTAGHTRQKLSLAGAMPGTHATVDVHRLKALSLVAEHGPLTVRVGYTQARLTAENSPVAALTAALDEAGAAYGLPPLKRQAGALAADDKKASFASLGVVFDQGNALLQSELGRRKVDAFVADTTAWYVLGGYRLGAFTPYVSYAALASHDSVANTVPARCPAGYPTACTPTLQALSAAVDGALAQSVARQSTISAGVRWNIARSAAFKLQADRVRPRGGSGLLADAVLGVKGSVMVYAAGVDFIF